MTDGDEKFLLTIVGLIGAGAIGYLIAKWLTPPPAASNGTPPVPITPPPPDQGVHMNCSCLFSGDCNGQIPPQQSFSGNGIGIQT